ncbi:MAG: twin-arginine translocation signal domain-containing protein [Nitrososphaera sp.]
MRERKESPEVQGGRRSFLKGLLTGAGVAVALGMVPKKAAAQKKPGLRDPVLYRRTEEVEKYYRTLYR